MPLERYREIVPDWDAFVAAHGTPEPTALRVRGALSTPSALIGSLSAQGFTLDPVPGVPGYLAVRTGPGSVAQTLEHWLGHFHVQQAVMGLPSLALAPAVGERVLDLCAAPGGKTLHLAELMGEEGPLVAVDPKEKRLRGLLGNVYRMGVSNVLVIAADGRELPSGAAFDRVLVDAPCSGEGNYRRQGRLPRRKPEFTSYVTTLQEALLRRAIQLTRPGGSIVYSTCTYAPEENELVVDRVLRDCPVRTVPIALDAPHEPGVTRWDGRSLHEDLEMAWRVYPHHLDSGGLFMVRLKRSEGLVTASGASGAGTPPVEPDSMDRSDRDSGWSPVPAAFPGEESLEARARIQAALQELEVRFGYQRAWSSRLGWMVRGDRIWLHTALEWPIPTWRRADPGGGWRVVSLGLRALRAGPWGRETPSSHFFSRWPEQISPDRRAVVDDPTLLALLSGEAIEWPELPAGPVALEWDGRVLGRGMVGRGGLRHELGKAYAKRLRRIVEVRHSAGHEAS